MVAGGADRGYILTVSRLEEHKRVHLLVEGMRHCGNPDARLKIAGTGPSENELRERAAGDPRIEMLGRVPDDDLAELYAHARAVAFVPEDEDYGFITVEAMRCGRPVLTARDSGGPTEFVDDGQTGLVVDPTPAAIGAAIDRLTQDPEAARRMGAAAAARVAGVSWEAVVDLITVGVSTARLTLAAGRPDFHGRAFWEAVAAQGVELEIVALTEPDTRSVWRETAENVRELHVPLRLAHALMLERWLERPGATEALALGLLFRHTPEFGEALWTSARGAAAVVAAGAFAGPALLLHTGAALVVDAEDVSVEPSPNSVPLIGAASVTERRVSRAAALIRCHSERHATRAAGPPRARSAAADHHRRRR